MYSQKSVHRTSARQPNPTEISCAISVGPVWLVQYRVREFSVWSSQDKVTLVPLPQKNPSCGNGGAVLSAHLDQHIPFAQTQECCKSTLKYLHDTLGWWWGGADKLQEPGKG